MDEIVKEFDPVADLTNECNWLDAELGDAQEKLEIADYSIERMQRALATIALNASGWVRKQAVDTLAEEGYSQKEIEECWPELKKGKRSVQ